METNFEWSQVLAIYIIGIFYIVFMEKFIKDMSEYGIKRWKFGIIYIVSGLIGMYIFGVKVDLTGKNLYVMLWNLLKDSPIDFGVNVIITMCMYTLFALMPMVFILYILLIWNMWKKDEFDNKRG